MLGREAKTGYGTRYEISAESQTFGSGAAFRPNFLFNV